MGCGVWICNACMGSCVLALEGGEETENVATCPSTGGPAAWQRLTDGQRVGIMECGRRN